MEIHFSVAKVAHRMQNSAHAFWKPAYPWGSTESKQLTPSGHTVRNKQVQLWRCDNGHQWFAPLESLKRRFACPKCTPANTSQAEQFLFRHVKQVFDSTQNRADLFFRGKHIEVDIFVPDIKFAIEYDGYHHSSRAKKDEEQNYLLTKLGIQLLRVRVVGLPQFQHPSATVITHDVHDEHSLSSCLFSIRDYVKSRFPLSADQESAIAGWSLDVATSSRTL
jgi:very-short-patch-repair endonuclease